MNNISVQNLAKALCKIITVLIFANNALAQNIIRDSEIDNVIKQIAEPVVRAAGFGSEQIRIFIIDDNKINAFTPGDKEIYINSGLLKSFERPDVIRGVIAHELGHIIGNHRPKQSQNAQNYSNTAMSAVGLGLAIAGIMPNASKVGYAIALGGTHYAERSMLHYSRIDESIADKTALRLLEQSGHTSQGLIQLLTKLHNDHHGLLRHMNPYDLTHPLSEARLSSIKKFLNSSKHKQSSNDFALTKAYLRAQTKLKAFTDDLDSLLKNYSSQDDEIANYAKAIIYFRKSQKLQALAYIDSLLNNKPNDAYYNELKGQILLEFGSVEALKYYSIALQQKPDDVLLKLSNAVVKLEVSEKQKINLDDVEKNLQTILIQEKDNLAVFYYLSMYYDKIGLKNKSQLMMATFFLKKNDISKAKTFAKQAIKGFKINSPKWYQANDIINIKP